MTVRLLVQYGTYGPNTLLTTGAREERRLLLTGQADANLAAGVAYSEPADARHQTPVSARIDGGAVTLYVDNKDVGGGSGLDYGTVSALTKAVDIERASVSPRLTDGQPITVAAEAKTGAVRRWDGVLKHARRVEIGAAEFVLDKDSNTVLETSGVPENAVGISGDYAVDRENDTIWRKSAVGVWKIDGPIATKSYGWKLMHAALANLWRLPNFGASAPDTTVGKVTTNKVYFDPQLGSDANSGATYLLPKQSIPSTTIPADTTWLVAAGSTLFVNQGAGAVGNRILLASSNCALSVYDRATGAEIVNQPNPFVRALAGKWITQKELDTLYFKIECNGTTMPRSQLGVATVNAITIGSAAVNALARGFWLTGWGSYGVQHYVPFRMEDFVIENGGAMPDSATDFTPLGIAVNARSNGAIIGQSGNSFVRGFLQGAGTDTFFESQDPAGCYDGTFSDLAIRDGGRGVRTEATHVDIFQMPTHPGNFVLRRCVIEHVIYDGPSANNNGLPPVANVWQLSSNGTPPNPTFTGGLMEDVVIASNCNAFNMPQQSGVVRQRILAYLRRHSQRHPTPASNFVQMSNGNAPAGASSDTDIVWIYENPMSTLDTIYRGNLPTKTNVKEIRG